jgi:minor extracellular serine protease Vpr
MAAMSGRRTAGAALAVALVVASLGALAPSGASEPDATDPLYLVTLAGPGTAGIHTDLLAAARLRAEQDSVLETVGGAEPVYRWTTALNGVAVHLSAGEAADLRADPRVALVERNVVRPLAGHATAAGLRDTAPTARGGAGVVVGLVDSGLWPDSPLFSAVTGLGRAARGFTGACETGDGWPETTCNRKVLGARWFVDGFGTDHLRSASSLSPLDDDGHGTQVASIVGGNAGVPARVRGQRLGTYAGVAPQARLAVYKACWSAPDPSDDGCATADVVSAIDAATADGVDVLNLSVGGPPRIDTIERALLGATEGGVVVVGAAGNAGHSPAAHRSPWVTTVGAATGPVRRGRVVLPDGVSYGGAMATGHTVGPARVVRAADVPATGSTRREARVCTPGSLDAGPVADRVVLCERGVIGRVDKSAAVELAGGTGMILVNVGPGDLVADFHRVPTVHVDRAAGRALERWLVEHPDGRIRLEPRGLVRAAPRVVSWSSPGTVGAPVVKPDVVATGVGVLGAVPPDPSRAGWDLLSGTSASSAITSGVAALVLSRHEDWSPAMVRSALATTARRVPGAAALQAGAGRVTQDAVVRPGLVYDVPVEDYRAWLDGDLADLNTPSIRVEGPGTVGRTVTNRTARRLYFSSAATGFARHQVRVRPAALRLGPGESATFTITVSAGRQGVDDGWVTWRGATGTVTRIPVVVSR